jgi:hypothetical protein
MNYQTLSMNIFSIKKLINQPAGLSRKEAFFSNLFFTQSLLVQSLFLKLIFSSNVHCSGRLRLFPDENSTFTIRTGRTAQVHETVVVYCFQPCERKRYQATDREDNLFTSIQLLTHKTAQACLA